MAKTVCVNLYGAPGAGKSTGAAYIFAKLKMAGIDAELVTEYAKGRVYQEDLKVFEDQHYVLAKQGRYMGRLKGKVDVIITDSPIMLGAYYAKDLQYYDNYVQHVLKSIYNEYDNLNYFLMRDKPYNPNGRYQTEEESNQLGVELEKLLQKYGIEYMKVAGRQDNYDFIVNEVLGYLKD